MAALMVSNPFREGSVDGCEGGECVRERKFSVSTASLARHESSISLHGKFIADDIVSVAGLGGEQLKLRQKFGELRAQRPVFDHFGGVNVTGNEFRIARHVAGALVV